MTRVACNRILKDTNNDICDNIYNHIYMTNSFHVKSKFSPILQSKSLVKDLLALQRSRSLRDPSTTIIADLLSKDSEKVDDKACGSDGGVFPCKLPYEGEWSEGVLRNLGRRGLKSSTKVKYNDETNHKTLSRHLNEISLDSDEKKAHNETVLDETNSSIRGSHIGFGQVKRSKFCQVKRAQNEHSTSLVKDKMHKRPQYDLEDLNVSRTPQSRCGIPFNWSRIHHSGKSLLDMAGKSLSCGLSDPRLNRDTLEFSEESEQSNSFKKSNSDVSPSLVDESASQNGYLGDLGISSYGRHRNLTQKYIPQTFKDLVGQNLVVKALSNAIVQQKVGFLYVFYGPHGTGKTSAARIFARALNCQSPDHSKPCGFCSSCQAYVTGKCRNIKEINLFSNFDIKSILYLLNSMVVTQQSSQYNVLILDDCDTISPDCWIGLLKVIGHAPKSVVFLMICSSLDALPHLIVSRCQKFFFPKLKDAEIIGTLECIAKKEGVKIDIDALELIASQSDGSLRDAEMILDQLILLGRRISVTLVQELVGVISDEKLVDLLDLALSANTTRTITSLREIIESGIEPLALMSQLASVITDILAGSYSFKKVKCQRNFFRQQSLSQQDMKKLRMALKTLSEADKQLRTSNDKLTWLTAALLQLAPEHQHSCHTSSVEGTSLNQSHLALDDQRDINRKCRGERFKLHDDGRCLSLDDETVKTSKMSSSRRKQGDRKVSRKTSLSCDIDEVANEIEKIWLKVMKCIEVSCIKEFMCEGKLISVSYGAAPTVRLMFNSPQTKSKAEKFRAKILQAFETVLGSPVTIEIRCKSRKYERNDVHDKGTTQVNIISDSLVQRSGYIGSSKKILENRRHSEADKDVELGDSLRENELNGLANISIDPERGRFSVVPVIHRAKGTLQCRERRKLKAVSIAEKLEEENMRLESKSRTLLCWNTSQATRRKRFSRSKTRTCRPHTLLKLMTCGKYVSSLSSR